MRLIIAVICTVPLLVKAAGSSEQFGPLMEPFLPFGERLSGFPEVFPGLNPGQPRYLLFPEDSAATFEESVNRCRGLGASLALIQGPEELETLTCLLKTPAYVGGWALNRLVARKGNCMVLIPGGGLIGTEYLLII